MQYQNSISPLDPPVVPEVKKPLKGTLIKLICDSRSRVRAIIALVLVLACAATMAVSYFVAKNTSVFEIPVVDKILEMEGQAGAQTEGTQVLNQAVDAYEEALNTCGADLQTVLTPEEYQKVVNYLQTLRNCAADMSLENVEAFTNETNDLQNLLYSKGGSIPAEYQTTFDENRNTLVEVDNAVQLIDQNGRTILWRRFNRDDWAIDRFGGKPWSEKLPENERITINGQTYVHWYDCISDYIL